MKDGKKFVARKPFPMAAFWIIIVMGVLFIAVPQILAIVTKTYPNSHDASADALARAQDLLNATNNFTQILGVVLAVFGVIIGILAWLGANLYTDLNAFKRELEQEKDELDTEVKVLRDESQRTRQALLYLNLGDRLLTQDETAEAVKYYEEARKLLPDDVNISYIVGRMYSTLGDAEAAISAFEASLSKEPTSGVEERERRAEVLKEIGLAYRRRGSANNSDADIEQATSYLKQALALNAHDSDAHSILGGLYRRRKQYDLALAAYKKAWEEDHGSSYAVGNLASLSWYLDRVDEAKTYFGVARVFAADRIKKGTREGYWDFYDLALARLALGEVDEAEKNYQQAIKGTPGPVQLEAVLDNLRLLQRAKQPMKGLDRMITLMEEEKNRQS